MLALTSWYVDAARRRLHEAVGDLLVVGIGEGGVGVVGALLRVAGVEVVDLVPRQVRLTQLKGGIHKFKDKIVANVNDKPLPVAWRSWRQRGHRRAP